MLSASMKSKISSIWRCASSRSSSIFQSCFHLVWVRFSCFETTFRVYCHFSRGMRFWEVSKIFWTLLSVFPRYAELPSGFCISFFPGPHLRVSCAPQTFRVTRMILSHKCVLSRNETTCFGFRVGDRDEKLSWDISDISNCFPAERREWLLEK